MLNDHNRNKLYQKAIERAICRLVHNAEKQKVVEGNSQDEKEEIRCKINILDVGCGTGLWGMVAGRCLQAQLEEETLLQPDDCHIESIDMSRFMVQFAQQVVQDNQLAPHVTIREVHSNQFQPSQDYNDETTTTTVLCISELLEHGLLGEGWLPTIRDLLERSIVPRHVVLIPSRATVYAQAVQTCFCSSHNNESTTTDNTNHTTPKLEGWSHLWWGPHDVSCAGESPFEHNHPPATRLQWPPDMKLRSSSVVLPIHASTLVQHGRLIILSQTPVPILEISSKCPQPHKQQQQQQQQQVGATMSETKSTGGGDRQVCNLVLSKTGRVDAILVWWKLHLLDDEEETDDEGTCYSSLDPNRDYSEVWQDHWQPCLHLLKQSIAVSSGDTCTLHAWHNDHRIHVSVMGTSSTSDKNNSICNIENNKLQQSQRRGDDSPPTISNVGPTANDSTEPPTAKRRRQGSHEDVDCKNHNDKGQDVGEEVDDGDSNIQRSTITPLRARQLNDSTRMKALEVGLQQILQSIIEEKKKTTATTHESPQQDPGEKELAILDVSDLCLCGLLAARLAAGQHNQPCSVFSLESSSHSNIDPASFPVLSAQLAQANLVEGEEILFQVIQCQPEALSQDVLFGDDKKNKDTNRRTAVVDLVVAEPYYEMTETWPLVSALNFFNIVRHLYDKKLLSQQRTAKSTCILPASARIVACVISSSQLYSSYQPCGGDGVPSSNKKNDTKETVLGLDHSFVNHQRRVLGNGTIVLSLPMWQYHYTVMSPTVCLTTLHYEQSQQGVNGSVLQGSRILPIQASGICHGLIVWVEYDLINQVGSNNDDRGDVLCPRLSTCDECNHQLAILLDEPFEVQGNETATELICAFQLLQTSLQVSQWPFHFNISMKENG